MEEYEILKRLLELDANPHITNDFGKTFIDYLENEDFFNKFKKDFPEIYEDYLTRKNAEKYNL